MMAGEPRLPLLSNSHAWRALPRESTTQEILPAWARMLAGVLPLTTARAIELDAMHRSGDRLNPRLRALARWSAADANRCEYGRAMAAADFAREGGTADISVISSNPGRLTTVERLVVQFSRRMMTEAYSITDAEVAELLAALGEERLMALVLLLAHASYQDRIFLAFGTPPETTVPPPVSTRFRLPRAALPATHSTSHRGEPAEVTNVTKEWVRLRDQLAKQKERAGRIRIPSRAEVLEHLGVDHPLAWQAGIAWSRACFTYQPELTDAWFACTASFRQETSLDPVFTSSVFWVVTDALNCFY